MATEINNAKKKSSSGEQITSEQIEQKQSQAYSKMRFKFAAVVISQILMLATFAAPKAYTLNTGKVIHCTLFLLIPMICFVANM